MAKYKLSLEAREDLKNIYKYTFLNFGIKQAKSYMNDLVNKLNMLADRTLQGRKVDEFIQGLRRIETGSHIVFYFNKQEHIFVVRVLHKSMDIKQHI